MELVGDSIPQRFYIGQQQIFTDSDTLYFNRQILVRGEDYRYDATRRLFDLTSLKHNGRDTLVITYSPLPAWFKSDYGRPLPEIVPAGKNNPIPSTSTDKLLKQHQPFGSDLSISGSKSFRFSARSAGNADFGQSLDLSIAGQLAPGLQIQGAISDRGYNPAYGVANSRLNELDKIHLQLTSSHFRVRIGDIELKDRFIPNNNKTNRLSGVSAELFHPDWQAYAVAARPKGLFQTTRFMGEDQQQGPYSVRPDGGPIVPASEQVWLDGQLLVRGLNNDYTMDYSTGRITFNVNHPIDRRSRIEIDYEPQASDYRKELFSGGGGVAVDDSSLVVAVEWLREGDDKNQLLTGELSTSDRRLLETVGDSIQLATRSGVTADTSGSYIIISDSLPDTVFQFVGTGNGDYTVSFSFVGSGNGSYSFLGNGRYQFVGHNAGDYMPFVTVIAPERIDYYKARLNYRNDYIGDIKAEIRQSRFDKNLLSSLDDNDNNATFYLLTTDKQWQLYNKPAYIRAKARLKEAAYHSRSRLYTPDFARRYFLPEDFTANSDEYIYELNSAFSPLSFIMMSPFWSQLRYQNQVKSNQGGLRADIQLRDNITTRFDWNRIRVDDNRFVDQRNGKADIYNAGVVWRFENNWRLATDYNFDRRVHSYTGQRAGTRYHNIKTILERQSERVEFERYVEDSLTDDWQDNLRRSRLAFQSTRRLGNYSYSSLFGYQWLRRSGNNDRSFLGRLNMQYNDIRRRLQVSMSYLLSDESRRARGITYLEVERGRGNYIFEDGEYRPDPDGNYIRVEELLSQQSRLTRGEKLFHFSKDWSLVLLRLDARIEEELLENGRRSWWWVLPFYSDEAQPYQYYNRRYNSELRMFPVNNVHTVTLVLHEDREVRLVGGSENRRQERRGSIKLKQPLHQTFFEEEIKLFETKRDAYFTGAGNFDGYQTTLSVRQLLGASEIRFGGGYRRAKSAVDELSEQYLLNASGRLSVIERGELQLKIELYRQSLSRINGLPSFVLTNNRPGERGGSWSVRLRYGVKKGMRLNFQVSGRHADNRTARITGRGEMVAEF